MQKQMMMLLDDCAQCGQPIIPGEPYKQTAWVDMINGRIASSKPQSWHLKDHCPNEAPADGEIRNAGGNKMSPEGNAVLDALRANLDLLGELAARYEVAFQPERPAEMPTISSPQDVYNLLGPEMSTLAQEQLRVVLLDTRNQLLGQRIVYQGNINSSIVRPAEVLRPAVIEQAPSIIVVHNHPSHDPTPSPADVSITRELTKAGKLLGIELLDHVVIAGKRFVSLKERNLMET